MSATPPPNSVEIEAKRLLRDLSHCPETAKEPLIWNALNSQRRSADEEAFEKIMKAKKSGYEEGRICGLEEAAKVAEMSYTAVPWVDEGSPEQNKVWFDGNTIAKSIRSLLEVKG